ncbi:MAG: hypothetical protein MZV64_29780 [Ignavibacteriales bacterium]|nr:hypothetical protein [Ignavibacteriales bacterium]
MTGSPFRIPSPGPASVFSQPGFHPGDGGHHRRIQRGIRAGHLRHRQHHDARGNGQILRIPLPSDRPFRPLRDSRAHWNTDIVDATLSGPEPITTYLLPASRPGSPRDSELLRDLYANLSDGFTWWVEVIGPRNEPVGFEAIALKRLFSSIFHGSEYAPCRSNNYSMLAKLTYRPSGVTKLSYSFNQSIVIDQNTQAIQSTRERVEPNPDTSSSSSTFRTAQTPSPSGTSSRPLPGRTP